MASGDFYMRGDLEIVKESDGYLYAELPHQCDQWRIGGPEQVCDLILDLQAALEKMLEK